MGEIGGDVLLNSFDRTSYILFLAALIAIWLTVWMALPAEGFVAAGIRVVGSRFNQVGFILLLQL